MAIRAILLILGLLHLITGLWMLADPMAWYAAIPGVVATGPANMHFIGDVGLAFMASGAGLMLGFGKGVRAAAFALAGSAFPALHALFHIWGWFAHGVPTAPNAAMSEFFGVVTVSALGVAAAWLRMRQDRAS
jgi:hypothetical protein